MLCRRFHPRFWIPLIVLYSTWLNHACASKEATLDPSTIEMLSNILESLDTFRNDRLRDLEKIRLASPPSNATSLAQPNVGEYLTPKNSSVSEHIKALKEGIMGHNPVKKSFGYKVTVYTSPIEDGGKDGKPVLVTQYVGGDMKPADPPQKRVDDLDESANDPQKQLVFSSESALLPVKVSLSGGAGEGHEATAHGGEADHNRKTEHSASSDKGHQKGHKAHVKLEKGHDHERHSDNHGAHHKETDKEEHRHDEHAHDKGGASQQGIRERTEIEYYEREHFLDTEYDKAKKGHSKTSGVKEHESHNDHDSHDNKKIHSKDNAESHKSGVDASSAHAVAAGELELRPSKYSPPYGIHYHAQPHGGHEDEKVSEDVKDHKEDSESSKLHHSEASKGHREHNHEKDHHSEHEDTGYLDKDKGRRKEGYRERGYKITAEREYFLNDAHHDKGHASHTSGSHKKDKEGATHGAKEGERDRGFVKEEKKEEEHDAAYDAKERHYSDGEQHKEGFASQSEVSSANEGQDKQEEVVPLGHPGVNYLDDYSPPIPVYTRPIAYAPSDDRSQPQIAYPPKFQPTAYPAKGPETIASPRQARKSSGKNQPPGGFDDDDEDISDEVIRGYVGQATYRKRNPSPLVSSIRDSVRRDVHSKPPSYATTESSTSSEENSVRFPDVKKEVPRYGESDESKEEVHFPTDEALKQYIRDSRKRKRNHPESEEQQGYRRDRDDSSVEKQYARYPEPIPKRKRYQSSDDDLKLYSQPVSSNPKPGHRDSLRYVQDQGSAYPQLSQIEGKPQNNPGIYGHLPSKHDVSRTSSGRKLSKDLPLYPQQDQHSQPYPNVRQVVTSRDQLPYPNLQQFYRPDTTVYGPTARRVQQEAYNQPQHLSPRAAATLQQLQQLQLMQQQQTKPPFSPVVLLSRGPPTQGQKQAVDVWYTRQQK